MALFVSRDVKLTACSATSQDSSSRRSTLRANVRRAISSNWASATGGPRDVFISGSWSITKRLKSAPHERETCRDRGVQTGAETGALRDKKKDRGRREMVEDKEEKRSEIGTQRLHINLRCYSGKMS